MTRKIESVLARLESLQGAVVDECDGEELKRRAVLFVLVPLSSMNEHLPQLHPELSRVSRMSYWPYPTAQVLLATRKMKRISVLFANLQKP